MILKVRHRIFSLLLSTLFIFSCQTQPGAARDTSRGNSQGQQVSGGLAEEIRGLTESGILSSMVQALDLIRTRELSGIDFGRMMNGINSILIRLVYPDSPVNLPTVDLPQTYNYTRIIREAERGSYTRPSENSNDFFEHILPFIAVSAGNAADIYNDVLKDLDKAGELRPSSVLPPYFRGILNEYSGRYAQADAEYKAAYAISDECYPALAGIARVTMLAGNTEEAAALFSDLVIRYPDNTSIKRQLAVSYFENRDWSRALPAIDEILQIEPRNGEFLLMKAHILIEQGQYPQANAPLEVYASINSNNRSYLFMRARVQAEGNRNRDSALNYLRSIIRNNPDDTEALIYTARLLMESSRASDQGEGMEILARLRQTDGSSIEVLSLSLRDAVRREEWQEAQSFLNRILPVRRTVQDLTDGYYVERGLGNNARALTFARELYDRDNSNNEYAIIYISALIDNARRDEASRLIESRLASLGTTGSGTTRSRLFFLRSRIQGNEEAALSDLRSSQFEDPRNLDALIAMFEIYHNRREERRAVYYLRQALAISPDHPRLRRYRTEYASLLQ
ncbi:MAG: tetratricopeptide repeat protein [Treponema sp.]|nr:tetratricopeptide repeat protein [Treponema sp.]